MKIKLDENLPADLAPELAKLGHEAHTLDDEGLSGARDSEVWEAAQSEQRFLITQDLDFSDVRRFAPGTHPGVLLVRLSNPSRRALFSRVLTLFQEEAVGSWVGCFVVATDRKVRIRRPGE
jgi:predicted nuclease of predicted toxin-antitoxin system